MKSIHKITIIICSMLLMSTPGFAVDGKVIPGVACEKSLGIGSFGGGAVRNNSTSGSLTVECPIVRDVVFGGISYAWVRLYNSKVGTSACTLNARSVYGTVGYSQYKSVSSAGYKTLSFSSMSDHNNGHYYFWCAIAPSKSISQKSKLISYRMDES